ncbi:uncharacterized protein CLUP02_12928 [Colletotrichum lupini]|uniref:Uncharacterized protein n=1 Tax=Colletotrichum lupini TaxID=145971 RepID=A0A9Q8T202_9PEZI|nr:uncharacterized protein CLUP02_12928 [Colletotrichum lupini]UQC87423.1 hypothetical protein CLUP02_12928 [Colletotrichum lupini]
MEGGGRSLSLWTGRSSHDMWWVADSGWKVQADEKVSWVRTADLPSLPSRKEFKLISTVAAPSFFEVEANVSTYTDKQSIKAKAEQWADAETQEKERLRCAAEAQFSTIMAFLLSRAHYPSHPLSTHKINALFQGCQDKTSPQPPPAPLEKVYCVPSIAALTFQSGGPRGWITVVFPREMESIEGPTTRPILFSVHSLWLPTEYRHIRPKRYFLPVPAVSQRNTEATKRNHGKITTKYPSAPGGDSIADKVLPPIPLFRVPNTNTTRPPPQRTACRNESCVFVVYYKNEQEKNVPHLPPFPGHTNKESRSRRRNI